MALIILQETLSESQEITFFKGATTKELKGSSRQWLCLENYSVKHPGGFQQNDKATTHDQFHLN